MVPPHPSKAEALSGSEPISLNSAAVAPSVVGKRYLQSVVVLLILNSISALLFVSLVNHPVFDDLNNLRDVHRYATQGVSVGTIRNHVNPTGPTSFILMAGAIRMLGGSELRDARLAVLLSWLLLSVGLLIGARYSSFPQLWNAAMLVTLIFPHTLTATATVLTEGPAMLFAVLGALVWVESVTRSTITQRLVLLSVIGGMSMGVAVTCRQYYLALVPAAVMVALHRRRERSADQKSISSAKVILSLTAALVPVLLLILIWKGLSSPGMASGASYSAWKSKVGLNFFRPVVATFYTALYLVPLTLPGVLHLRLVQRRQAFLFAVLGGTGAALLSSSLLQPGPLRSVIQLVKQMPTGESIFFGLVAAVTIYNSVILGHLLWDKRNEVRQRPPVVFALLMLLFFIVEQVGVGGNIPFYELYVLQVAPFLGIIAFDLQPRFTSLRLITLVVLSLISHALLWRYAFGG